MRTAIIRQNLERCLCLLDLIEKAEQRYNEHAFTLKTLNSINWRDELKYFPLGAPRKQDIEHNVEISFKALKRLEAYYTKCILKINYFVTK